MRRRALALMLILAMAALATVGPAAAEHTPHHRYFFVGTVRTESGDLVCGVTVRAYEVNSSGSSDRDRSAATDLSGGYSVQLHMHSGGEPEAQPSEVGAQVVVTVEGVSKGVTVVQNQGNPDGWGQLTVDLIVPDSVRNRGLCLKDVLVYTGLAAIGVVLVVVVVLYLGRTRRRGMRVRAEILNLPGVTRAKARELQGAGIRTLVDLSDADPDTLARATDLTAKQARLLVKRAQDAQKQRDA